MAQITIYGYESFDAWVKAGCPGARSFNADGTAKAPKTHLSKCRLCDASMVRLGLCIGHLSLRQESVA